MGEKYWIFSEPYIGLIEANPHPHRGCGSLPLGNAPEVPLRTQGDGATITTVDVLTKERAIVLSSVL